MKEIFKVNDRRALFAHGQLVVQEDGIVVRKVSVNPDGLKIKEDKWKETCFEEEHNRMRRLSDELLKLETDLKSYVLFAQTGEFTIS